MDNKRDRERDSLAGVRRERERVLLVSLCCDTAQAVVFLLESMCCDTAQPFVLLLVSKCCDTV